jgi:hypothetical protein
LAVLLLGSAVASACGARTSLPFAEDESGGGGSGQGGAATTNSVTVTTGTGGQGGQEPVIDSTVISLSPSSFFEAETHLVVHENRVVVSWIAIFQSQSSVMGYAISDDQGATFSAPQYTTNPNGGEASDPVMTVGPDGTVYLAWLGYQISPNGEPSDMRAYVASLPPGAASFGMPVTASDPASIDQLDKPWMTTTSAGTLILSYARIDSNFASTITVARSTDGQTWTRSDVVAPTPSAFRNLAYVCAAANSNRLHIVELRLTNSIRVEAAFSDDEGATWSTPVSVSAGENGLEPNFDDPICVANGSTVLVGFGLTGEMVGGEDTSAEGLEIARSDDGGVSFPTVVAAQDPLAGARQLHPAIARAPGDELAFAYYAGAFDGDTEGSFRLARTSGLAFPTSTVRVLPPITFTPERASLEWLGDYVGLASDAQWVHMSFAVNQPSESHIAYARAPLLP